MKSAKKASYILAASDESLRNRILIEFATQLDKSRAEIAEANARDLKLAEEALISGSMYKRLILDDRKISVLIKGIEDLIKTPDPLADVDLKRELDNGLVLSRKRVPIGVIGVIFESRPDALVQISSLCVKSGNVVVLKGGKEALYTNRRLFEILQGAVRLVDEKYTQCMHLVETREEIKQLLAMNEYIDLMIPRGSNQLVSYIQNNTKIPVLGHADGICHMYIDSSADPEMAVKLVYDAKCQYPAVCNALETLLIHYEAAEKILPSICAALDKVEWRGDEKTRSIVTMKPASGEDWSTEYNDLVLSIKTVGSVVEAVDHINTFGSHHTDAIVANDKTASDYFVRNVDSAAVLHNCSTRFSDGFRFGFGAEVGISTNKIHARGPVGIEGLTIYKYILEGNGQDVAPYADGTKAFTHKDLI
jgi:glutamate-5-semialdehyde dehydrogenase